MVHSNTNKVRVVYLITMFHSFLRVVNASSWYRCILLRPSQLKLMASATIITCPGGENLEYEVSLLL